MITDQSLAPVSVTREMDGQVWRVELGGAPGHILDRTRVDALAEVFVRAAREPDLKAICLEGRGQHFSFGASVEEHLPGEAANMLERFHGLLLGIVDSCVVTLAAVRGQCLGGGLELVTLCHRVFAAPDARFGQPEIKLGVFAPAASVMLTERVGRGAAEDLCLSGRSLDADEARRIGLVDAVSADPMAAALAYAREHLVPRSASSLRLAVKAARLGLRARLARDLDAVEVLYLDELMRTVDAVEGLRAFVEKRTPAWVNR